MLDGRFRIERLLGQGGMGVVYLGKQVNVDRDVAIKVLRPDRIGDRNAMSRFETEARAISRLKSPHTVTLVDFGMSDHGAFIVMEYLEGATLQSVLRARELTIDESVRILDQVALSIAEAHARGIVHGDLKPSNVLLARAERHMEFAKVVDFGLAATVGEVQEHDHVVAGTPRYIAPERIAGGPPTLRADVYALGVMAYELFAGKHPFAHDSTQSTLQAQLSGQYEPLGQLADLDEAGEKVVRRAMARDPKLRFADAGAFRDALREAFVLEREPSRPGLPAPHLDDRSSTTTFLSTQSLAARPAAAPRSRRAWWLAGAAAAGLMAIVALGAGQNEATQQDRDSSKTEAVAKPKPLSDEPTAEESPPNTEPRRALETSVEAEAAGSDDDSLLGAESAIPAKSAPAKAAPPESLPGPHPAPAPQPVAIVPTTATSSDAAAPATAGTDDASSSPPPEFAEKVSGYLD